MLSTIIKSLHGAAQSLAAGHFKAEEGKVIAARIKLAAEHLEFTETKLKTFEKDIAKLEVKNENLEQEHSKVKAELAKLDGSAKLVDIGPCCVKEDKYGNELLGFYCSDCKRILTHEETVDSLDGKGAARTFQYSCYKCNMFLDAIQVDQALNSYQDKNTSTTHST